jgi:hypothetical protein
VTGSGFGNAVGVVAGFVILRPPLSNLVVRVHSAIAYVISVRYKFVAQNREGSNGKEESRPAGGRTGAEECGPFVTPPQTYAGRPGISGNAEWAPISE